MRNQWDVVKCAIYLVSGNVARRVFGVVVLVTAIVIAPTLARSDCFIDMTNRTSETIQVRVFSVQTNPSVRLHAQTAGVAMIRNGKQSINLDNLPECRGEVRYEITILPHLGKGPVCRLQEPLPALSAGRRSNSFTDSDLQFSCP